MALHQALQVPCVVVAERVGGGAGAARPFPQRGVGQRVHVDHGLLICNRLQQAQVGGVARLADQAVFLPEHAGKLEFEFACGVCV